MSAPRPSFDALWHRVAELRPRLRGSVRVTRQHFRGALWHVVEEPATGKHHRLSASAWRFVGLLDGRRTVDEARGLCERAVGDAAPTRSEAVRLLGALFDANLLAGDIAPEAAVLLRRDRKRRAREMRGRRRGFLLLRIPLYDPELLLERCRPAVAWIWTPLGAVAWLALVAAGLAALAGGWRDLSAEAGAVLAPRNLPILLLVFAATKLLHEAGHAFACKVLARRAGQAGEVHELGVMLLALLPVPYVDVSAAWMLRSKWHRIVVNASGMLVEVAVAAVAAIVWSRTAPHTAAHAVAFNVVLLAGVQTLLFNANPLLRYDGYYILADLLETPNLGGRAQEQVRHLVRRYAWGLRASVPASRAAGESVLLTTYGVLSALYRPLIYAVIIFFVATQLPLVGVALAAIALAVYVVAPLVRFAGYLATDPELGPVRGRAIGTTGAVAGLLVLAVGAVPLPDHAHLDAVVDAQRAETIHAAAAGWVRAAAPPGAVEGGSTLVVRLESVELATEAAVLRARIDEAEITRRIALAEGSPLANVEADRLAALRDRLADVERRRAAQRCFAPIDGTWIPSEATRHPGGYVERGAVLGSVVDLDSARLRAVATQDQAGVVDAARGTVARFRSASRPDRVGEAAIRRVAPAATDALPSPALARAAGGGVDAAPDDTGRARSVEPVFEILLEPARPDTLRIGERVVLRVDRGSATLAERARRALLRLVLRRRETPA